MGAGLMVFLVWVCARAHFTGDRVSGQMARAFAPVEHMGDEARPLGLRVLGRANIDGAFGRRLPCG